MSSEWTVAESESGIRLDKFLADLQRVGSRSRAAAALERGKVLLNGAPCGADEGARRLQPGDRVRFWVDRPGSAKRLASTRAADDLAIVYEDGALVALDKPAGLLAVPLDEGGPESARDLLERRWRSHGKRRAHVVHRIDRDTSGLILFAKDERALSHLQAQFRRREPERVYLAIVHGCPDPAAGVWRDRLRLDERACLQTRADPRDRDAHDAVCRYRVVERFDRASLIEVRLETGRRNQIRVQAGLRGHALVGEERYRFDLASERAIPFGRQALHAWRLTVRHPDDERVLALEAPLADDMRALVERLR